VRFPNQTNDVNVVAVVKGDERYVFIFDDDNRNEACRTASRWAANPELSFTWYDAAVATRSIKEIASKPPKGGKDV